MDYLEPFLVIDTAWCTNASPGTVRRGSLRIGP